MRNTVLFLSCLLASLWISIAFADNGVERGSIEYSAESEIPSDVRAYLEKLMFSHCELRGAATIRPNFYHRFSESGEFGNLVLNYKIDFEVTFKKSSEVRSIYADLDVYQDLKGETQIMLRELISPICTKPL